MGQTGERLAILKNHSGRIKKIAFAPHGRYLVAADCTGRLQYWDLEKHETFMYNGSDILLKILFKSKNYSI